MAAYDKSELIRLSASLRANAETCDALAREHGLKAEKDLVERMTARAAIGRHYADVLDYFLPKIKIGRQPRVPVTEDTPGFTQFWSAYPRKVGKGNARAAWLKWKCEGRLEAILETIERAKKSEDWKKDRGQFIPHPATWINREGWEDNFELPLAERPVTTKAKDPEDWRDFLATCKPPREFKPWQYAPDHWRTDYMLWKKVK